MVVFLQNSEKLQYNSATPNGTAEGTITADTSIRVQCVNFCGLRLARTWYIVRYDFQQATSYESV